MKAHLQGTLTVGVFVKATAKDGTVLRIWNGTRNKIVDGELYLAYPLSPTRFETAKDLKADNMELMAVYANDFTARFLRARRWQGARVEYRILNYKDFTMGYAERRVMFLGKTTVGKHSGKVELLSLSSKLAEPVGQTCNKECDVSRLGDTRCGVDLETVDVQGYAITIDAEIVDVDNRQQVTVAFDGDIEPSSPGTTVAPDQLFRRGTFLFSSGENDGGEGLILTNTGNLLTFYLPLHYLPEVGDTLTITSGCDRKINTCRDKFANAERFRGHPYVPGRSKLFKLPE